MLSRMSRPAAQRTCLRIEELENRLLPSANPIDLSFLGRYSTGQGAGTAEIVAHDPITQRLFVVNGAQAVDVVDISNPASPTKLFGIPINSFGGAANSAAFKNGVLAVAIEATVRTNPGVVVFFDANGAFLKQVTVGAVPDMITFTPNGAKVLVANEGEPSSYNQPGSVDPEGSVSIIDLSAGVASATVQHATFQTFIGQEAALRSQGIRIFGPNATAAQDLEPEYITVSADSTTAWVTLQENNALAIINIATATVTQLVPLGFKDHSQASHALETYQFTNLPVLGTTTAGQNIPLGGFSGLHFEGTDADGNLKFITHTDRGPNGEPIATGERPFLLPAFTPEIIRFTLNRTTGVITLTERIQLKKPNGDLLTGLPNTSVLGGNANTANNDEVPIDLFGTVLGLDPLGGDLEGIVVDPNDGTFWMCDEYRPAIYHFAADGTMINRFIPFGTHAAAGVAYTPGTFGVFGTEALPAVLGQRRQNRGFEAIAFQDGKLYAFVQSPLRNPTTSTNGQLNARQNVRLVEFDPTTLATRQFLYIMDNPADADGTRADKIGDMVAIGNGQFLVVERDDDLGAAPNIEKKVYRLTLAGATAITPANDILYSGKTLDQMTATELTTAGINAISKVLHVDLDVAGYNQVSKVEGLTVIDANTIAVLNDNDFTVGGAIIDFGTGTFTLGAVEPIVLGLITTTQSNALDASDRDNPANNNGVINIQNWPVFGMYQPDAIASFQIAGQTYLITANEGDARDYAGFAEEARVGALALDPTAFPTAGSLKNNDNLGRLTVTSTLGNPDADGDFDQLFAFGARSFSIWSSTGQLVYDSGDDLERITAELFPALFNSDGLAGSFDTRSDNKGPEPEAVTVGVISGRTYAFLGLERIGGVMVFDVTTPTAPVFIQYLNTSPNDIAPEGMLFIKAEDSPISRPLVVGAHEVSGTVALFQVNEADLVFNAPAGARANDMTLRQNGANLELIDNAFGTILFRQALAATESVTINGVNGEAESLTIDFAFGGAFSLPEGVAFHGGAGAGDRLRFLGTAGSDTVTSAGASVNLNGLDVTWSGVEALELAGTAGNDVYAFASLATPTNVQETGGIDTLDFSQAVSGVSVNLGLAAGQSQAVLGSTLRLVGTIEHAVGSAFSDALVGSNAANDLFGGGGADFLSGEGGNDFLDGGSGNDALFGGTGNDILLGRSGSDLLNGGAGRDLAIGGAGIDILIGLNGGDILIGGGTTHDDNREALDAIMAEWASSRSFSTRRANLNGSGGGPRLNGPFFLNASTLINDGAFDLALGFPGLDWQLS